MLTAIVLTVILTAAAVMALSHRSRSYIYNLEQTAMNQAEELSDLQRSHITQGNRLDGEMLNTKAAHANVIVARAHAAAAELKRDEAQRTACALRVELELMRHERDQLWGKLGMQPDA